MNTRFLQLENLRSLYRFLSVVMLISCFACSGGGDTKVVDFSKTIPVESPEYKLAAKDSLRVAVASMISPKETSAIYRQVLDYVGSHLGLDVELIQRKTYGEVNELLAKGQIDLAFICSGPYATGKAKYGFQPLASPQVQGSHSYRAYLIVNKDSPFQHVEDLRGRSFAFTDPESNTGRLVPYYWLSQMGEEPATFFSETIYTYSHDNSILAVSRGLVDAASVHGLIWDYYHRHDPAFTDMTRIIKKSEPYGSPPLVASKHLSEEVKEQIRQLLLSMHHDPEGQVILKKLMIDRFLAPREEWYDGVRKMKQTMARLQN